MPLILREGLYEEIMVAFKPFEQPTEQAIEQPSRKMPAGVKRDALKDQLTVEVRTRYNEMHAKQSPLKSKPGKTQESKEIEQSPITDSTFFIRKVFELKAANIYKNNNGRYVIQNPENVHQEIEKQKNNLGNKKKSADEHGTTTAIFMGLKTSPATTGPIHPLIPILNWIDKEIALGLIMQNYENRPKTLSEQDTQQVNKQRDLDAFMATIIKDVAHGDLSPEKGFELYDQCQKLQKPAQLHENRVSGLLLFAQDIPVRLSSNEYSLEEAYIQVIRLKSFVETEGDELRGQNETIYNQLKASVYTLYYKLATELRVRSVDMKQSTLEEYRETLKNKQDQEASRDIEKELPNLAECSIRKEQAILLRQGLFFAQIKTAQAQNRALDNAHNLIRQSSIIPALSILDNIDTKLLNDEERELYVHHLLAAAAKSKEENLDITFGTIIKLYDKNMTVALRNLQHAIQTLSDSPEFWNLTAGEILKIQSKFDEFSRKQALSSPTSSPTYREVKQTQPTPTAVISKTKQPPPTGHEVEMNLSDFLDTKAETPKQPEIKKDDRTLEEQLEALRIKYAGNKTILGILDDKQGAGYRVKRLRVWENEIANYEAIKQPYHPEKQRPEVDKLIKNVKNAPDVIKFLEAVKNEISYSKVIKNPQLKQEIKQLFDELNKIRPQSKQAQDLLVQAKYRIERFASWVAASESDNLEVQKYIPESQLEKLRDFIVEIGKSGIKMPELVEITQNLMALIDKNKSLIDHNKTLYKLKKELRGSNDNNKLTELQSTYEEAARKSLTEKPDVYSFNLDMLFAVYEQQIKSSGDLITYYNRIVIKFYNDIKDRLLNNPTPTEDAKKKAQIIADHLVALGREIKKLASDFQDPLWVMDLANTTKQAKHVIAFNLEQLIVKVEDLNRKIKRSEDIPTLITDEINNAINKAIDALKSWGNINDLKHPPASLEAAYADLNNVYRSAALFFTVYKNLLAIKDTVLGALEDAGAISKDQRNEIDDHIKKAINNALAEPDLDKRTQKLDAIQSQIDTLPKLYMAIKNAKNLYDEYIGKNDSQFAPFLEYLKNKRQNAIDNLKVFGNCLNAYNELNGAMNLAEKIIPFNDFIKDLNEFLKKFDKQLERADKDNLTNLRNLRNKLEDAVRKDVRIFVSFDKDDIEEIHKNIKNCLNIKKLEEIGDIKADTSFLLNQFKVAELIVSINKTIAKLPNLDEIQPLLDELNHAIAKAEASSTGKPNDDYNALKLAFEKFEERRQLKVTKLAGGIMKMMMKLSGHTEFQQIFNELNQAIAIAKSSENSEDAYTKLNMAFSKFITIDFPNLKISGDNKATLADELLTIVDNNAIEISTESRNHLIAVQKQKISEAEKLQTLIDKTRIITGIGLLRSRSGAAGGVGTISDKTLRELSSALQEAEKSLPHAGEKSFLTRNDKLIVAISDLGKALTIAIKDFERDPTSEERIQLAIKLRGVLIANGLDTAKSPKEIAAMIKSDEKEERHLKLRD